jgi:hypothetical protein
MKKKLVGLFALVIAFSLVSCATLPPVEESDKQTTYTVSYGNVFDAVKTYLFENNIEITAGSKDSGFINARKKLNSEMVTAIMTGSARVIYTNYQISFTTDNNQVKVMAKIYTAYSDGSYPTEASKQEYQIFWNALNAKLLPASSTAQTEQKE